MSHRPQHSSSSNSSTGWSALSDEEDDDLSPHVTIEGENTYLDPYYGEGSLQPSLHPASPLLYARRPSSTNHRSTIPVLHRRGSSISSPLAGPVKSPKSAPLSALTTVDDLDDVPPISLSSSLSSNSSRKATLRPVKTDVPHAHDSNDDQASKRRSRNRTSLPAYFSLLQVSPSSPSSSGSSISPTSRQALTNVSQSLRTSPTTPRSAHPLLDLTPAHGGSGSTRPASAVEATPRGRSQRRDPDPRSTSGRRSQGRSPPRQSSRAPHDQAGLGSQVHVRLESVEKVFEWVTTTPVVDNTGRGRTVTRRNSSPPKPVKHEICRDAGALKEMYARSKQQAVLDGEDVEELKRRDTVRGQVR